MEQFHQRTQVLQHRITTLQRTDTHLFPTILTTLIELSHAILAHDNAILQSECIPQIDALYIQLFDKIERFIDTDVLQIHQ